MTVKAGEAVVLQFKFTADKKEHLPGAVIVEWFEAKPAGGRRLNVKSGAMTIKKDDLTGTGTTAFEVPQKQGEYEIEVRHSTKEKVRTGIVRITVTP